MPNNAIALLLLIGGTLAACAYAYLGLFADDWRPVQFAIASLVAVIGWNEVGSVDQIGESSDS